MCLYTESKTKTKMDCSLLAWSLRGPCRERCEMSNVRKEVCRCHFVTVTVTVLALRCWPVPSGSWPLLLVQFRLSTASKPQVPRLQTTRPQITISKSSPPRWGAAHKVRVPSFLALSPGPTPPEPEDSTPPRLLFLFRMDGWMEMGDGRWTDERLVGYGGHLAC